MKRAITAMGLGTLAVMAVLGVFAVGSASAQTLYLFLFSEGTPLPALILILNDNNQVFKVEASSAISVVCKHFGGMATVENGKAMYGSTGKVNGNYSKCSIEPSGLGATISEAEYEVNAQGSVSILKPIDINVASTGCLITVGTTGNSHLLTILFLNQPTDVLAHVNIGGISSTNNSTLACGTSATSSTTGSYTGLLLIWVHGGTIQWHS